MDIFTPAARARIVQEMFSSGIEVPQGMISRALAVLDEAMAANQIKFFAHKGYVKSQKVVPDYTVRVAGAKETLTIAQMLSREREAPPEQQAVAMEYDPRSGVLRLVVGTPGALTEGVEVSTVPRGNVRQAFGPSDVPPLAEGKLDDILLGDLKAKRIVLDEEDKEC